MVCGFVCSLGVWFVIDLVWFGGYVAIFGCVVLCVSNLLFGRLVFASRCIGWVMWFLGGLWCLLSWVLFLLAALWVVNLMTWCCSVVSLILVSGVVGCWCVCSWCGFCSCVGYLVAF